MKPNQIMVSGSAEEQELLKRFFEAACELHESMHLQLNEDEGVIEVWKEYERGAARKVGTLFKPSLLWMDEDDVEQEEE